MTFGEKLFKLRKEKKMSQEALAEKLDTTRQAVSKWENDQGDPEAEKIIALSVIFEISTDYLLKPCDEPQAFEREEYYVNREKAESWLLYEKTSSRNIALGLAFLLPAGLPFLLFTGKENPISGLSALAMVAVGIGAILAVCLNDRECEYRSLKRNVLLFDGSYLKELKKRYDSLRKKYAWMIVISFAVILVGAAPLALCGEPRYVEPNPYGVPYSFLASFSILQ